MASVEQRIYQNSPTAPSPRELKDGLGLLLDTHGVGPFHSLSIDGGIINPDGLPNVTVLILPFLRENGTGSITIDSLSRVKPKFEIGKKPDESLEYKFDYSVEVYSNSSRDEVTAINKLNGQELTDTQRRAIGGVVLAAWEKQNQKSAARP